MSVCLAVACLELVEVWLRHDGRFETYYERNGLRDPGYGAEQLLEPYLHIYPKNEHALLRKTEFTAENSSNSEGLVDAETPVEKAPGEFRILTLGDSFTEGVGASVDRSYPAVLRRLLSARPGQMTYTVMNAGISGSDPVFAIELLRRRLLKYQPDLVLMMINSSDVDDLKRLGGFDRFAPNGQLRERPLPWWTGLFERSHLLRAFVLKVLHYDWNLHSPDEARAGTQDAIQDLIQSGIVATRLAAENGFKLIVIVQPTWWDVQSRTMIPELVEVENGLRSAEVDYADLLPYFVAELPTPVPLDYYWPKDFHFTAKGYEILARAVQSEIRERGLLH